MSIIAATDRFIAQSSRPFYPCLLLVHPEIERLQSAVHQLVRHYQWPKVSIGRLLAEYILAVSPRERSRKIQRFFGEIVDPFAPGPIICTDIDLLFEPSLSIDPLRLLQQASRTVELVVLWPGTFQDGCLAYSVAEHGHYRAWTQLEACDYCVVDL